jgi:hypothetical protein
LNGIALRPPASDVQINFLRDRDDVWNHVASAGGAQQHILVNAEPLALNAEWLNDLAASTAAPIGLVRERLQSCTKPRD